MDVKGHFKTITTHKIEVMKNCFRAGIYWQGLMHDMSKYTPTEFIRGCKYYTGTKSPNEAERRETGMSRAWLHHKGRNKHHFEYWIDYDITPGSGGNIAGMKMPVKYVVEMVCDRIAASKVYLKENYTDRSPYEYFERSKSHYVMHPETMELLGKLLKMLADHGEDYLFAYIRKRVL